METSGGVDEHYVGAGFLGALQCFECHGVGLGSLVLLDYRHTHALAPNLELLYGRGAEGIGCAEHHRVARGLELGGEFADGGGLAYAVYTNYHDYVRLMIGGNREIVGV